MKYWALLYKIKQSSGNIKQIMDALAEIAAKVNFVQECTKSIQRTLPSYFQVLFLIVLYICWLPQEKRKYRGKNLHLGSMQNCVSRTERAAIVFDSMWSSPILSLAVQQQLNLRLWCLFTQTAENSDFFQKSSKAPTIPVFFKENVRYPVWTCRDPISLILETRFSMILKHLKKTLHCTRIGSSANI